MGRVAACGLPDTLVHGDFAPGNARGAGPDVTLLDWGDTGVGHPLLDQSAMLGRVPAAWRDRIEAAWHAHWRVAIPGSDAARAARLLRPVAAARQVVAYQRFLDGIEPSERRYHAADPLAWLRRAAALGVTADRA